jgi:pimeloyl-ACP methyl ester carboxylesterase
MSRLPLLLFADLCERIAAELVIFERCSHAPMYEDVAEFNEKTLKFLKSH